jgi:osmotically-inducible protein OsmY
MSLTTPSTTEKSIQDRVEQELDWTREVEDAANIGVAVHDGVVSLSGEVGSYSEKVAAAKAAMRVRGVGTVANDLVVRYPGSNRTDAGIARAAQEILRWIANVPKGSVKIEVRDRVAILTGEVEWDYQRRAARRAVENIAGVEGVFDRLTLTPRASAKETKTLVKGAILRNAVMDARSIKVDSDGTTVILRGQVASNAERAQAELAAWSSPHVMEVDNQITIRTP